VIRSSGYVTGHPRPGLQDRGQVDAIYPGRHISPPVPGVVVVNVLIAFSYV
jgi:hypothetical protein